MLHNAPSAGGNFAAGAQMGTFNHLHASQMANIAQQRRHIANSLGAVSGGLRPVQRPVAPVQAPGMQGAPGVLAPPAGGNFKAHIAHAVTSTTGQPVSMNHVHAAIDRLTSKGTLTPMQGTALKLHNGPLMGPQGNATMAKVAKEVAGV